MFPVFQLTALVALGPATRGESFIINLDQVAIKAGEMRCVLLCVQDFVPSPVFIRGSFFPESGLTMFFESVALADSITSSSVNAPWSLQETACANQVVSDLRACWDRVVLRRRNAGDTNERLYHGGTPRSELASKPGVRILDVVEEGRVGYVPVASPALGPPGPSKVRSAPANQRERSFEAP